MKDYKFGEVYEGRIPKEQAEKFAILWGEGSPNLKNLIQYCILNDIKTTASCKGHKSTDKPYISFKMDEKFCKNMINQLENSHFYSYAVLSRFGDRSPVLSVYYDKGNACNDAESFFEEVLNVTKDFVEKKYTIKPIIFHEVNESISKMYSKDGEGKKIEIFKGGCVSQTQDMPQYMVDSTNNVIYAYSPLKKFCKASKQSLSEILKVNSEAEKILIYLFLKYLATNEEREELKEKFFYPI